MFLWVRQRLWALAARTLFFPIWDVVLSGPRESGSCTNCLCMQLQRSVCRWSVLSKPVTTHCVSKPRDSVSVCMFLLSFLSSLPLLFLRCVVVVDLWSTVWPPCWWCVFCLLWTTLSWATSSPESGNKLGALVDLLKVGEEGEKKVWGKCCNEVCFRNELRAWDTQFNYKIPHWSALDLLPGCTEHLPVKRHAMWWHMLLRSWLLHSGSLLQDRGEDGGSFLILLLHLHHLSLEFCMQVEGVSWSTCTQHSTVILMTWRKHHLSLHSFSFWLWRSYWQGMIWECVFLLLHQCTSPSYLLLQLLFCGGQLLLCVLSLSSIWGTRYSTLTMREIENNHVDTSCTSQPLAVWTCKHDSQERQPRHSSLLSCIFWLSVFFASSTSLSLAISLFFVSNCSNRVFTKCKKRVVPEDHIQCLFLFVTRPSFYYSVN